LVTSPFLFLLGVDKIGVAPGPPPPTRGVKVFCTSFGFCWISLDRYADIYYNGVNKLTCSSKGTIMILCDYCANLSTSNQVCTECGEPLVDNPEMDFAYEYDGQPSELTEWMDFDPDC
jgi:hypothetical protein